MVAIFREVFLEGSITKDIKTKLGFFVMYPLKKTSLKMATLGG
jgi:hypothetical protein